MITKINQTNKQTYKPTFTEFSPLLLEKWTAKELATWSPDKIKLNEKIARDAASVPKFISKPLELLFVKPISFGVDLGVKLYKKIFK